MRKFSPIGLMAAGFFSLCMVGCNGESISSMHADLDINFARSSLARETLPQVSDTELAAVVSGNTEFALKVFPLLDTSPDSNTFFSPYSITQAFALLAPGARGNTLTEIEQTLSFPLQPDRRNAAFNKLDLLLAGKTNGQVMPNGQTVPRMTNANAVWGQKGFPILPGYLDVLAVNYGAGLNQVDFIDDTEEARQSINTWVEDRTNDRIKDLIPQGGVSTLTRLVLTNAVWFKSNWASQFSENNTTSRPFTSRDGSSSPAPFMRQTFSVPYSKVAGCQAVDLPYAGDELSMLVIMPDAGTFDRFLGSLTPTVLADITGQLATKTVDLSLPKFTFTRSASMRTILESLGMREAFDPALADLSGIDGQRDLFVDGVFHQAFIAVDEVGTEAAAATGIVVGITSAPIPELTLTVDHPFVFLIRDRETGLVIFLGKVVSL